MGGRGKRRKRQRERQPADNPIAWEVFRGGHHVKVSFLCATSGTLSRPARTEASLATLARAANKMCVSLVSRILCVFQHPVLWCRAVPTPVSISLAATSSGIRVLVA